MAIISPLELEQIHEKVCLFSGELRSSSANI